MSEIAPVCIERRNKSNYSLMLIGNPVDDGGCQIVYNVFDADGQPVSDKILMWNSSEYTSRDDLLTLVLNKVTEDGFTIPVLEKATLRNLILNS